MLILSILSAIIFAASERKYTLEAQNDMITSLPGLPPSYTANQFSGYINVTDGSIFYWYVEAQKDPETAPLIWWTNGGPGCSGFNGFLEENGPFRPNEQGTLDINSFSWNREVNMVFVEQPVGVGFSKMNKNRVNYSDSMAANNNHDFITGFFARYPELYKRPFYLSSESYGGHYLPTLAKNLVDNPIPNVDFRGFLVGNPLTYLPYRDVGEIYTYWGHQLVPMPITDEWMDRNCSYITENDPRCSTLELQIRRIVQNLDPYALDFPTCTNGKKSGRRERWMLKRSLDRIKRRKNKQLKGYFPTNYEPCEDEYTSKYLNRYDVQQAIHAQTPNGGTWDVCSNSVNAGWPDEDVSAPMMPYYDFLVQQGLDVMIYSGDDDSVCSTSGTQQFLWDMGWTYDKDSYWQEWDTNGVVSGFETTFTNGFIFKTVHGAGHMVPSTRPEQALDLLMDFLNMQKQN